MALGHRAGRAMSRGRAWLFVAIAFAVQTAYLAWQLHDYVLAIHAYPPRESAFGSVYVTILGLDHAHVLVGLVLEAWLLLRLATRITRYRLVALRAAAFYTHAVNAITVVVLVLTILPSV
jgi:heme/copper-type cytochrome/quinol oxidase subunit 3